MPFLTWMRCTNNGCRCHRAAASYLRGPRLEFDRLVNEALIESVFEQIGPDPGFSSLDERRLALELSRRMRLVSDGERVRACPWQLAREVLAAERPKGDVIDAPDGDAEIGRFAA